MARLIDRRVAIEAIKEIRNKIWDVDIPSPTVPEYIEHHQQMVHLMNECDNKLHELYLLPSAQPEPRWIPCSERLPEEGVNVLLCIKDWESQKTKMVVSLRRDYNYWDGLGRDIRGDIAWMPLPEPYRAERITDDKTNKSSSC